MTPWLLTCLNSNCICSGENFAAFKLSKYSETLASVTPSAPSPPRSANTLSIVVFFFLSAACKATVTTPSMPEPIVSHAPSALSNSAFTFASRPTNVSCSCPISSMARTHGPELALMWRDMLALSASAAAAAKVSTRLAAPSTAFRIDTGAAVGWGVGLAAASKRGARDFSISFTAASVSPIFSVMPLTAASARDFCFFSSCFFFSNSSRFWCSLLPSSICFFN
mmetsp:Transcript_93821/g.148179  ORF Transcript_93821/g.148179 Transcript_93821/m.148179 type:complete len:224 (+) Transcript_93821:1425-2096(+)